MKITVINGTEKHGVSYRMKELFLEPLRAQAEITEFYLPRDCPNFCTGCTTCFRKGEQKCRDAAYVGKIERAMLEADLLVFLSPAYVFHATGAMKSMLDHFGYRWMPHRPAAEMFGKRAVIITQCLGAGAKSTARDIKDSLTWWGISDVTTCAVRLMSEIAWESLPEKKRAAITSKLNRLADRIQSADWSRPGRTGIMVRGRFLAVRMLQKQIVRTHPDSLDYLYWKEKGWLGSGRPWKQTQKGDRRI